MADALARLRAKRAAAAASSGGGGGVGTGGGSEPPVSQNVDNRSSARKRIELQQMRENGNSDSNDSYTQLYCYI